MSNDITISGLSDINSINPNGVYQRAEQINGKDSWERTIQDTTFSIQYYVLVGARNRVTQKWQLVNKVNLEERFAIGSNTDTPWESIWQDNGQPYGIPVVAEVQAAESIPVVANEVVAALPTESRFDMYADGNESGEERFYRLLHLGYL